MINSIPKQDKFDLEREIMSTINRNVYALRKKKQWTQQQLADAAGIQPYQICYIEGCGYYKVTLLTIGLIANALDVTLSAITNPNLL